MGRWPRMRPWHLDRDRVGAGRAAPGGLSAVEGGDPRWEELGRLVFGIERDLKMRLLDMEFCGDNVGWANRDLPE